MRARRGLQRLLADALAPSPRFAAILVYDVSRWGRFQDIDEGAHYEFICRQAGVAVHYCAEPFENEGSPEANLIKHVKRAMAAEFSRAQSERIALARGHAVSKGATVSMPPFALRRLMLDAAGRPAGMLGRGQTKISRAHRTVFTHGPAEEVATVRAIFRWFVVTGLSPRAIAAELNRADAPSLAGRGWSSAQVRAVLRQEAYAGTYVHGRTRHRLGAIRKTPAHEQQRIEGVIAPIVDRARFDLAARYLRARRLRSEEELLEDLGDLLDEEGAVSSALIDAWPFMASSCTYTRRFGSLAQACARIGHEIAQSRSRRRSKRSS